MEADEQRDQDREGDGGVEQPEQPAEPPGGPMQQGEAGGTAGGERLADAQVDEESGDPGPVGGTVRPSMTAPAS